MKIILLFALFCTFGYGGVMIGQVFKNKVDFFTDANNFCNLLKNEISFMKTDLLTILSKTTYTSKFNQILSEYEKFLKQANFLKNEDFDKNHEFNKIFDVDYLSQNEKNLLCALFNGIGKLSYEEQINELKYFENEFDKLLNKKIEEKGRYMPLSTKMGFLVGLIVCIVLI